MTDIERHPNYLRIYRVVRRIPAGRVATYGQIAALAGLPGHARQVGYALFHLTPDEDVPWQRVVNSRGEISARSAEPDSGQLQRAILEAEGVRFDDSGRIDMERLRWDPGPGEVPDPASN